MMKAGYPPIDIKFTDRIMYYNAFDAYHVKHDLSAMENLLAGYVNASLDKHRRRFSAGAHRVFSDRRSAMGR